MSVTSKLMTLTLPEFSDLTRKEFTIVNEMVKPVAAQLFNYLDLTASSQDSKRIDEVDVETFAKLKREGENAQKVRAGVGYNKTLTAKRVAAEIDITWEMRRYGDEYKVKQELYNLNHFVPQRQELDLTHRISFATSTSYTDMDGDTIDTTGQTYAIAYSAQTLKNTTGTYRNRVTSDPAFGQGALESAEELFVTDIMNNFGQRRIIIPNLIISTDTPSLVNDIKKVLQSTADVDAAHAGVINVYATKYTHIALPYLATDANGGRDATKKRWWGLGAFNKGGMGWQAYFGVFEKANLKTPTAGSGAEDTHNDNWTYGARGSYGIATLTGRGLVMSCPTS